MLESIPDTPSFAFNLQAIKAMSLRQCPQPIQETREILSHYNPVSTVLIG